MLRATPQGLYCEPGGFFIDPIAPVDRAVITHAHGEHARPGSRHYLTSAAGQPLLRECLGSDASVQPLDDGETLTLDGVRLSLHPAGHILGSSQVRLEHHGEVWVVSGDYKTQADPTCAPFEPLACHTFVTESTFALPIYRWAPPDQVFAEINSWWRANQELGRASLLLACPLGKAQRLLAGVDGSLGPIFAAESVEAYNTIYRAQGIALSYTEALAGARKQHLARALILAPPDARDGPLVRRLGSRSTAIASGWMRIRGLRRRLAVDRGFILSDHADWPALNSVIDATGAERVLTGHGYQLPFARWLRDRGLRADPIESPQ